MPSIWSALSSSSSASAASYPGGGRQLKGKSKSSSDIWKNSASNEQGRRLTRQRKLRHATDDELGLDSRITHERPQSLPVSPDCGSGPWSEARTPLQAGRQCHWSKLPVPKPLPLPEVSCQPKQNDGSHGPRLGNGGAPPGSGETRGLSRLNLGKTTDDMVTKTKGCPAYHRRGFQEDLNVDTSENDFCLHFPARSAPSSGCSSPVPISQRYRTLDLFHPLFQVSSASESVKSVTIHRKSKSHQVSPVLSPESSPFQSPTKQGNSKNCVALIHSHNKSLPESSVAKRDTSNSSVHPLPRPPTVSRPSLSTRNSFDKSNISSLKGQWQKGKSIGCGTYGNVYIATHRETGATCALKEVEMIPDDPKSLECIKQLEQEIKFLRELKHPNIVEYYGCEIIEDRFCIYLEYVHPGSISKYIKEHNEAMTESIVRNFTRHILSGLAYLHSTMTIHRDIKGANLLVDASGVVKLADFGLAKHLEGHHIDLSLKGTPHWMAPEVLQAAMRKDANPDLACGVDIWGLGCTVIEMLTGKPPWSEYNPVQAMFNVLNKSPAIPETLSAEGRDFLNRCFQRRPADRPTALELLEHPFLRSSQDQNTTGFVHESSGIKLHDLESSSKWARAARHNKDVMPNSSATRIQQGKLPLLPNSSSETNRHPGPEASESGSSSHQSPRCILETLPRISSPDVNWRRHPGPESSESGTPLSHQSPHCILEILPRVFSPPEVRLSSNSSSPSNVQNNLLARAVGNNIYSFSCKGNLDLKMPKMAERKKERCNVQQEIN